MAVARKPNTKANLGRAASLPHRELRILPVARTILIMRNAPVSSQAACTKMGVGRIDLMRPTANVT